MTHGVWQPIETAPKDGTEILVWCKSGGVARVRWNSYRHDGMDWQDWEMRADRWHAAHDPVGDQLYATVASHWMPLPSPPSSPMGETAANQESAAGAPPSVPEDAKPPERRP